MASGEEELGQAARQRRQLLMGLGGGALLALGCGAWWWRRQPPAHDHPRLTPAEAYAKAQAGEITLVDIRTPREWGQTGLPVGAMALDMRRSDFLDALDQIVAGRRGAPIALICARGVRSARLTKALTAAGFANVMDVPEGMLGSASGPGWISGNLPVARWEG